MNGEVFEINARYSVGLCATRSVLPRLEFRLASTEKV